MRRTRSPPLHLMVLEGQERAFDALDLVLVKRARECGAKLVAAMVGRRWARTYRLRRMGWLRSPHVFSLIVKRLADTVSDDVIYGADRWHTMWIDSDDL